MLPTVLSLLLLAWLHAVQDGSCSKIFGGYFPNWAQYREEPYAFTPSNMQEIAERLNHLVYSHIHFNSNNYSLVLTDEHDQLFLKKLASYKDSFPNLKILVSIGGDEFPSAKFSAMVKSNQTRAMFINNLQIFLHNNKIDGVEISWKWPCSPPKVIHKMHFLPCESFIELKDKGSRCPQDAFHFLALLKEMRHKLGKKMIITVSGSPFLEVIRKVPLKLFSKYVDYWHVETFGYALSATNHSYYTAPYSPLYPDSTSDSDSSASQCINSTVSAYLEAGVPSSKIIIGIPLHGNFWYVPNVSGNNWQSFGLQAFVQKECCGPYRLTFGARGGPASDTCGRYMYSEILAIQDVTMYYDKVTQTTVGYLKQDSSDGWTTRGTWFSYNDKDSIKAVVQYIKDMKLAGAFVSDLSEDSINFSTKMFTYELMNIIYSELQEGGGGGGSGSGGGKGDKNICNPTAGCNVCTSCCRMYLTNQFDCNACVTIKCSTRVCYPPGKCNVCDECCSSFTCSQMQCNYCVKSKCNNNSLV